MKVRYADQDFLLKDELRPVRLQLELLKPELILNEHRIEGTIVIFGGARIPEPTLAKERLAVAEAASRAKPDDPRLQAEVDRARRLEERSRYWERIIHFDALVEEGTIASEDIELFTYVETAEEAWEIISGLYRQL